MIHLATRTMMALVVVLLCSSTGAVAQDELPTTSVEFHATGASITEGETDVELDPTLTFTLNNPLPDDATLAEFGIESLEDLLIETGEATVTNSSVSGDRTEVSYELSLTDDTDYGVAFWGFNYDYESQTNFSYHFQPFAVNFTTAAAAGDAAVTGELVLDPDAFPGVTPDFTNALVIISGDDNTYVDVVQDESNQYGVEVVRAGEYIVGAFYIGASVVGEDTSLVPAFGWYDPDGDGLPTETISVDAGGTATADVTMGTYFIDPTPSAEEPQPEVPTTALGTAAPNPVHSTSTISYHLGTSQPVRLAVYDLLGREVAVLADGMQSGGSHTVTFNASGLPGGVYFYRLETADQMEARSLVIVR